MTIIAIYLYICLMVIMQDQAAQNQASPLETIVLVVFAPVIIPVAVIIRALK